MKPRHVVWGGILPENCFRLSIKLGESLLWVYLMHSLTDLTLINQHDLKITVKLKMTYIIKIII